MKNLLLSIIFLSAIASGYSQSLPNYWVPSSGTNTYATNITSFGSSYSNKIMYVRFANANTGASTINVNGIGAISIRKWNGTSWVTLSSGDIRTDRDYRLSFDTTNNWFRLEETNYTASNGIRKVGSNFVLGSSDITSDVTIDSDVNGTHQFDMGGTRPFSLIRMRGGVAGTNSGTFNVTSTHTNMTRTIGAGTSSIQISSSGFLVTDNIASTGFIYNADYSTNFAGNDRAIPDVGWVNLTKAPLYMLPVTYTANRVATTADVGRVVYMNVASSNTFTINAGVFPVGTFLNVRVLNAATTAVQGTSVTINPQSGSLVLNPNALNVFYQSSTNVWELYNGATFAYTDATLGSDVTVTTTGHTWTFTGGDFVATDGTRKFQIDAGTGIQMNLGSDATGDIPYRNSSGYLSRLGIGSDGQVLKVVSGALTWAAESGGVTDGDKGDITVAGGVWGIDAGSVSYGDIQNTTGGTRILGRSSASAGGIQEIAFTANGQTLIRNSSGILAAGALPLDDTDAVSGVLPPANGGSLSGTYTPTLTGELNVDATTAYQCQYSRSGNMVTVSGTFDCNVTDTGSTTQLGISLPISSNFTASSNCGGTSAGFSINTAGAILADPSNDRAQITWMSTTTTNNTYSFQFSYLVQ
jgi:hypothetical protein